MASTFHMMLANGNAPNVRNLELRNVPKRTKISVVPSTLLLLAIIDELGGLSEYLVCSLVIDATCLMISCC